MRIFIILALLLGANTVGAETIKLISGEEVNASVLERTDEYIKVESSLGIAITYYLDEIESIDGKIINIERAKPMALSEYASDEEIRQDFLSRFPKPSWWDSVSIEGMEYESIDDLPYYKKKDRSTKQLFKSAYQVLLDNPSNIDIVLAAVDYMSGAYDVNYPQMMALREFVIEKYFLWDSPDRYEVNSDRVRDYAQGIIMRLVIEYNKSNQYKKIIDLFERYIGELGNEVNYTKLSKLHQNYADALHKNGNSKAAADVMNRVLRNVPDGIYGEDELKQKIRSYGGIPEEHPFEEINYTRKKFYPNGSLKEYLIFENKELVLTKQYSDRGILILERAKSNGGLTTTKEFNHNGVLVKESSKKDFGFEGSVRTYFENGQLNTEYIYENKKPISYKEYDELGNLVKTQNAEQLSVDEFDAEKITERVKEFVKYRKRLGWISWVILPIVVFTGVFFLYFLINFEVPRAVKVLSIYIILLGASIVMTKYKILFVLFEPSMAQGQIKLTIVGFVKFISGMTLLVTSISLFFQKSWARNVVVIALLALFLTDIVAIEYLATSNVVQTSVKWVAFLFAFVGIIVFLGIPLYFLLFSSVKERFEE